MLILSFVHASKANPQSHSSETYIDPTTKMEFIFVQGGYFIMGG